MNAVALAKEKVAASSQKEREGVIAIVHDQGTLDRIQGVIRELQLDDEMHFEPTLDSALRRVREGMAPRMLILDLSDSTAPIAELSAARTVCGNDVKVLALGTVNDVNLYRDLLSAGANDYVVKPPSREVLAAALIKRSTGGGGGSAGGLGETVAFIGSRGGVGATTTAVSCAWLLSEQRRERTALLDLDLHFGTIALQLDTDPGGGLCEALEQPSRIDSLFIERAMVKVSDTLRILAAEAGVAEPLMIDAGAIDVLLYELRRKFSWVIVDLPRWVNPTHRVVLGAASRVVVLCERTLGGLRDTIRLQTLMREHAPQTHVLLLEAPCGERAVVGRAEFEKAVGKPLDGTISFDPKSAGVATNSGKPLPLAVPRSPVTREIEQLIAALGAPAETPKRRKFGLALW
jgi:pilus assembly protein CpaE